MNAENLPPEDRPASRTESDFKLELVELRTDNKFERMMTELANLRAEMREGFAKMETEFASIRGEMREESANVRGEIRVIDTKLQWLFWLTGGTFFMILGIILNALGLFHH